MVWMMIRIVPFQIVLSHVESFRKVFFQCLSYIETVTRPMELGSNQQEDWKRRRRLR
jgi:hypothetical protein